MDIPLCTSVIVGPWSIYSCKTSNHDDRCLVIKDCRYDSPSTICLHDLCKQARAVMMNSSSSSLFTYEHVKTTASAVQPEKRYFDFPDLQGHQCGDTMMGDLLRLGATRATLATLVTSTTLATSTTPGHLCHSSHSRYLHHPRHLHRPGHPRHPGHLRYPGGSCCSSYKLDSDWSMINDVKIS